MEKEKVLECKVVKVLSDYELVINKGRDDGIRTDFKFLVYSLGEELFDPDTKQSLGRLELVKGYGKAIHVQNKMTTIESYKTAKRPGTKTIVKNTTPLTGILGERETITYEENEQKLPFSKPKIGDFVKYIP